MRKDTGYKRKTSLKSSTKNHVYLIALPLAAAQHLNARVQECI